MDWPAAPFWRELSAAYPDAIILLSERDTDSWWRSASRTIFAAMATAYFTADAPSEGWTGMCVGMMNRFSSHRQDERAAKAAFTAYNADVRRCAAPEKLLVWQLGDGWAPLCARLGLPMPEEPFPHVNTEVETRNELGLPADA